MRTDRKTHTQFGPYFLCPPSPREGACPLRSGVLRRWDALVGRPMPRQGLARHPGDSSPNCSTACDTPCPTSSRSALVAQHESAPGAPKKHHFNGRNEARVLPCFFVGVLHAGQHPRGRTPPDAPSWRDEVGRSVVPPGLPSRWTPSGSVAGSAELLESGASVRAGLSEASRPNGVWSSQSAPSEAVSSWVLGVDQELALPFAKRSMHLVVFALSEALVCVARSLGAPLRSAVPQKRCLTWMRGGRRRSMRVVARSGTERRGRRLLWSQDRSRPDCRERTHPSRQAGEVEPAAPFVAQTPAPEASSSRFPGAAARLGQTGSLGPSVGRGGGCVDSGWADAAAPPPGYSGAIRALVAAGCWSCAGVAALRSQCSSASMCEASLHLCEEAWARRGDGGERPFSQRAEAAQPRDGCRGGLKCCVSPSMCMPYCSPTHHPCSPWTGRCARADEARSFRGVQGVLLRRRCNHAGPEPRQQALVPAVAALAARRTRRGGPSPSLAPTVPASERQRGQWRRRWRAAADLGVGRDDQDRGGQMLSLSLSLSRQSAYRTKHEAWLDHPPRSAECCGSTLIFEAFTRQSVLQFARFSRAIPFPGRTVSLVWLVQVEGGVASAGQGDGAFCAFLLCSCAS